MGRHHLRESVPDASDETESMLVEEQPHEAVDFDLEGALRGLMRTGWMVFIFGPSVMPEALAAVRRTGAEVDVLVLRPEGTAAAYRALNTPGVSPFDVNAVVWYYVGDSLATTRAILELGLLPSDSPLWDTPDECRVPESAWRPLTIYAHSA